MKLSKLIYKIILIGTIFIMFSSCISYASIKPGFDETFLDEEETGESSVVQGDDNLGLPDLYSNYKPTVQLGTKTKGMIEQILGVLTVIGVIVMVISIALIGFGTILGSAEEKAANQAKYVGILIAAILMTGGSAIAKMIINIAERL